MRFLLGNYFQNRFLLLIPTLLGITLISFFLIHLAPGGPLESKLQFIRYGSNGPSAGGTRGGAMISDALLQEIRAQYGLDQPLPLRYWLWLKKIAVLDFGESFTFEEPVLSLILHRLPVSFQFGLASFLFSYILSVPIGMILAIKANSLIDKTVQVILLTLYGIPPLILGMVLIVLFAGASHFDLFPMGGLTSDNYEGLNFFGKIQDRMLHFFLPLLVYVITGLTTQTILMRNSMLEVIKQEYIRTARAKGLSGLKIYVQHGLRNALIPMASGLGSFLTLFLSGSLIIETVFRIDGMGLLSHRAVMDRDYNLIMGLIVLASLLLMMGRLLSDLLCRWLDPRMDFE